MRAASRREPTPSDAQAAQCTSLDLILSKSHSGPPHCKSQAGASGAKPGAGGSRSVVHTEQGSAVTSANSNGSRGVRDSATADAYAVPLNLNRVDPRLAAPMLPDLGLLELDVTCQSESAPPAAESPTGTSAQAVDAATEQQRALKPSRVELPSRVSEFSWLRAVHCAWWLCAQLWLSSGAVEGFVRCMLRVVVLRRALHVVACRACHATFSVGGRCFVLLNCCTCTAAPCHAARLPHACRGAASLGISTDQRPSAAGVVTVKRSADQRTRGATPALFNVHFRLEHSADEACVAISDAFHASFEGSILSVSAPLISPHFASTAQPI